MAKTTFNIRIEESELELLKRYYQQSGRTQTDVFRQLIRSLKRRVVDRKLLVSSISPSLALRPLVRGVSSTHAHSSRRSRPAAERGAAAAKAQKVLRFSGLVARIAKLSSKINPTTRQTFPISAYDHCLYSTLAAEQRHINDVVHRIKG